MPARPAARPVFYGWVLVGALGVTTIISYGTTQYLFGVLVAPVTRELGWDRATVAGAYALGTVLSGFLGFPIGRLVDRHGARFLMAAGSALGGLALLGLTRATQPWQFYLCWAGGIGLATALTYYQVSFTVVAQWFARRRGSALALLTLVGGFASPIFIPLAGALVPRLGWRETVVVLAFCQLLIALPLHLLVVRRQPEDLGLLPDGALTPAAGPPPDNRQHGLDLPTALHRPAFWTLTAAMGLGFLGSAVLQAHSIAYLVGRGYDAVLAAALIGAVGVASLPGRFVLNILSDRWSPRGLLAACLAVQAVGVAALVQARSPAWVLGYVVVYGAAFGAISPLRASVLAEQFGRRAYGAIIAAHGVPVALLAGVGPVLAGWLYDTLGDYRLAFWLTAGAFLGAAVAVGVTPRPDLAQSEVVDAGGGHDAVVAPRQAPASD